MSAADPCNDHCASCPFACHSEVEDGHTPEWVLAVQIRTSVTVDLLSMARAFVMGADQ